MEFEPDFGTIKTINSVALEGQCNIIGGMRSESEFTLVKICILYLHPKQEQNSSNSIVIPLLPHMLSCKTEAFMDLRTSLSVPS